MPKNLKPQGPKFDSKIAAAVSLLLFITSQKMHEDCNRFGDVYVISDYIVFYFTRDLCFM